MSETTTPSEPPPSSPPWAFLALAGLGAVCVLATGGANLLPMGLAATAEEMSGQAEQLQQLMGFFTLAAHAVGERDKAANADRPMIAMSRPLPDRIAQPLGSAVPAGFVRVHE